MKQLSRQADKRRPARSRRQANDASLLRLDRFLPYHLSILASKVTASLAREYERAIGLQLPEARVMTVLGFYRPVSSNAIVQHTSMDKATVSRAIARLLRLGFLTRMADPRDRRLLALDFTPRGRRAYARLVALAHAWEAWFTADLGAGERARLEQFLARLVRRLAEVPQPVFSTRGTPARSLSARGRRA